MKAWRRRVHHENFTKRDLQLLVLVYPYPHQSLFALWFLFYIATFHGFLLIQNLVMSKLASIIRFCYFRNTSRAYQTVLSMVYPFLQQDDAIGNLTFRPFTSCQCIKYEIHLPSWRMVSTIVFALHGFR